MVAERAESLEGSIGVLFSIERKRRMVPGVLVPVGPLRILFLEATGVREEDLEQIDGAAGAVDRSAEALLHQEREISAVIDMGVREHHGIEIVRKEGRVGPVPLAQGLESLEQAAVE